MGDPRQLLNKTVITATTSFENDNAPKRMGSHLAAETTSSWQRSKSKEDQDSVMLPRAEGKTQRNDMSRQEEQAVKRLADISQSNGKTNVNTANISSLAEKNFTSRMKNLETPRKENVTKNQQANLEDSL